MASLEGVFMVLSGASSLEQLEQNIKIMDNLEKNGKISRSSQFNKTES